MNAAHSSARLTGNRTSTFSRFYFSDLQCRLRRSMQHPSNRLVP